MAVIEDAFYDAFPDAAHKTPAAARGLGVLLEAGVDLAPVMFSIYPGPVPASAILTMHALAAGRRVKWRAGTYEVDGALPMGAVNLDWISDGPVTLKLTSSSHIGGSWIRTDGNVSAPGFVFDGNNKVAKVFDARTSGTYAHRVDLTGATFKGGLQPSTNGVDPDPIGHSAGLVVDGKFDIVDVSKATFRDIDALATGTGASRPNSRGFAVMDGAKSPRLLVAHDILVENIVCSKKAWGESEIEADGFVYRNSIPEHLLLMNGPVIRNCQKRYVKANIALNTFITDPNISADAGKCALVGIDFQIASGHVRGGSSYFADAAAWPRAGMFSVVMDGETGHRSVLFRDHDIRCPEAVPDDGTLGFERCILTLGGSTPSGPITMTDIRADVSIPVMVHIRPDAISASSPALAAALQNVKITGNWVRELTAVSVRAARSGTGFVYAFLDVAGNSFPSGPSQTSLDLVDSNVNVIFAAGNASGAVAHNAVASVGPQGYVMQPPSNGQSLGSWPSLDGLPAKIGRDRTTAVGTTAKNIRPTTGATPLYGSYQVYGVDTTSATRWFFETVAFSSQGTSPPVVTGVAERNGPAVRTYAVVGAELRLSMASGTYDVQCVALGLS